MRLEDLIRNNYYLIYRNYFYCYFKYVSIDNENIYGSNFILTKYHTESFNYKEYLTSNTSVCTLDHLKKCLIRKIEFVDIIDHLPDTNIDKICYLRRTRIEFLLKK